MIEYDLAINVGKEKTEIIVFSNSEKPSIIYLKNWNGKFPSDFIWKNKINRGCINYQSKNLFNQDHRQLFEELFEMKFVTSFFSKTQLSLLGDMRKVKNKNIAYYSFENKTTSAIMIDGKILKGINNVAGRMERIGDYDVESYRSGVISKESLKKITSRERLTALYNQYALLHETCIGHQESIGIKELLKTEGIGDIVSYKVIELVTKIIVDNIQAVTLVVDPEVFIINLGERKLSKRIVEKINQEFQRILPKCRKTKIIASPYENKSAYWGLLTVLDDEAKKYG